MRVRRFAHGRTGDNLQIENVSRASEHARVTHTRDIFVVQFSERIREREEKENSFISSLFEPRKKNGRGGKGLTVHYLDGEI